VEDRGREKEKVRENEEKKPETDGKGERKIWVKN